MVEQITKRERLREYNQYLLNILRLYNITGGRVTIQLEKVRDDRKINTERLEKKLKDLSLRIRMDVFQSLTAFDNFMIEQENKITSVPHADAEKEKFQRWLGYKGRWKKEKPPKEKQPRKPRTWKLPDFTLSLDEVYLAEGAFTHRYSAARVTKGLSKLAKAGVMAGALVVYVSDKEWNGTRLRKVSRYANAFVPRMLTEEERRRFDRTVPPII